MEAKIQQVMANPDLTEVEFLQCSSSYLRRLASILALHYGLEPHCNNDIRAFARKKPQSRIPSVTLSGILNPGNKLTIPIKKCSIGASSSNLSSPQTTEPETKSITLEERKEEKPTSNSCASGMTEPQKRAITLEESKEEKPTSNLSASEMSVAETSITALEERKEEEETGELPVYEWTEVKNRKNRKNEKPTSNLYVHKMTEERTLKERKATSHFYVHGKTEVEKTARTVKKRNKKGKLFNSIKKCSGHTSSSNLTVGGMTEPQKLTRTLDERKEVKPLTTVSPCVDDAVQHPQFHKTCMPLFLPTMIHIFIETRIGGDCILLNLVWFEYLNQDVDFFFL
jgi:hypothetical protein